MSLPYDNYYKTEKLFGAPYPELIKFFQDLPKGAKVLDLGCGQGRDAIALARIGFDLTGIDNSAVGIDQMNEVAKAENLNLDGQVGDIHTYDKFAEFDIILLDSMFHFAKKDKEKEIGLIQNIIIGMKSGSLLVNCIQDTGNKVGIYNEAVGFVTGIKQIADESFVYVFEDQESGHRSETNYRMIVFEK